MPVPADRYQRVDATDGRLLLLVQDQTGEQPPYTAVHQLRAFDVKKKEVQVLVNRLTDYELSHDRKKLLLRNGRSGLSVVDAATGPVAGGTGAVDLAPVVLNVEPEAEWRQIFHETWRIARDFFYDPGMHGVDWPAVRQRYAARLPLAGDRTDLNGILGEMLGELNVGHAYVGGGTTSGVTSVSMGYLGADYEPVGQGAFRVTKLYPGDGFDLEARSPLLAPGVNVKVGDYLLALNGQPARTDQDLQALLVGSANQVVTLTVNGKPTTEGAREVRVKPLASDDQARYYDWVAGRRDYVQRHGGENLGYVHIPNMSEGGLREFAKQYYGQLDRDGLVYDVRNNGGGYIADMLLLQMASRPYSYFKPRYGASWTFTDWAFAGHSAALINQTAFSDAEVFADSFQRLKLGPVIGVPSGGGAVGSGSGYALIDGGQVFIPNYAFWAPDRGTHNMGRWLVEGSGAQPDIVVENDPAAVMAGRDPQLDRAITYLKEKLQQQPVLRPVPPPFPNKALGGFIAK